MGLKEKAIEMSEIYRKNPKVEAIILAGSVARKLEDEHSDIELHILWLSNRWHNRKALLKRKDWLMLYDVICEVQRNIFGVLFGLNKMYVHHPAFKWMPNNVERMTIKPEKLYERMADTLIGNPEKSVQELELLIEEVLQQV
ncbi:hypothetical protein C1I58_23935, partial [Bacillus sp. PIC28]